MITLHSKLVDYILKQVRVCLENNPANCGDCELFITTPTYGE